MNQRPLRRAQKRKNPERMAGWRLAFQSSTLDGFEGCVAPRHRNAKPRYALLKQTWRAAQPRYNGPVHLHDYYYATELTDPISAARLNYRYRAEVGRIRWRTNHAHHNVNHGRIYWFLVGSSCAVDWLVSAEKNAA
jgi:hypothetical protein